MEPGDARRRTALSGLGGSIMHCIGVAALAAVLLCAPVAAQADVLVNISKSQQRLAVTVDGTETYRWPVSTGRAGYTTPSGSFRPVRLERDWYSRKYDNAPMPFSVFFYRGYAVHGTMEARSLGHAASHGCVRLSPANASILFSLVRREGIGHTKVVVSNGPLPQAPRPPHGEPTADKPAPAGKPVSAETALAKAPIKDEQEQLRAKAHAMPPSIVRRDVAQREWVRERSPHLRTRLASVEAYSYSESSNEAQNLREREAWLRSIDRKYGIAR
jgi:L,D-transpeptidase catalytic domain